VINEIIAAVKEWRIIAKKFHIPASECKQMENAFRMAVAIS
jgi:hypothetical protein